MNLLLRRLNVMNKQIKELAEQAALTWSDPYDFWAAYNEELEHFAELVRQDEREACAKVADDIERKEYEAVGDPRVPTFKPLIGAAIRARGDKHD